MDIIAWDQTTDTAVIPERLPSDGEWARFTDGKRVYKKQYHPQPEPSVESIRIITTRAFMQRFTLAERADFRSSANDVVADIKEDLQLASYVDLDNADVSGAIDALVSLTLLEASRKTVLLADGTTQEQP